MKVKIYYLEITLFIIFLIELLLCSYIKPKSYFWVAVLLTAIVSYIY